MRRLTAALVAVALVVGLTASGTAAQASSATGKPVVIANGWSASDVGTAAPLAARLGGSVLYANRDSLGAATVDALAALAPSEVVLVGGTAVLSGAVETELGSAASGASVSRLAGEGRRHTAALAALRDPAVGRPVVIANGWSASDVGIAAPLAAKLGGSVLYSGKDSLGAKTVDALGELAPSEVVLVGGTGVLAGTVETELAAVAGGVGVQRIVGDDRLHTAALAALRDPATGKPVVIANGWSAPDVGTAAPLAAALGGSVLYANRASLSAHTIDALETLNPAQVILIGGTAALTADIAKELARTLPDATLQRIAGTDRIHTAAQAALRQYQQADTPAATTSTANATKLTAVSAANGFSCGIRSDGTAACWSGVHDRFESFRQDGLKTDLSGKFTAISAGGGRHACGIRSDGTAVCWGYNYSGQTDAPAGNFTAISAGGRHSCGIRSDGTAVCWGNNDNGQLDAPSGKFTAISAGAFKGVGWDHSCGIRSDGTAVCWGDNDDGQLDAPSGNFTAISAGNSYSCGIRSDGTAVCWGNNWYGKADAPSGKFTAISASRSHSCGIRADGTAVCWGDNDYGKADAPSGKFTAISAGGSHSCGIRVGGAPICWGQNQHGPLDAAAVPDGAFTAISAAGAHACGLRADGTHVCWGNTSRWDTINGLGKFTAISAGGSGWCGLYADGTSFCWGEQLWRFVRGSSREKGNYTAISVGPLHTCKLHADGHTSCWGLRDARFEELAPAGELTAISVGGTHTCGIRADGAAVCSANNPSWQTDAPAGNFIAISAGNFHSCGLRADGAAVCWGNNWFGQTDAPAGNFIAISAGGTHSCGIRSDGTAVCWGSNSYGQADVPAGKFTAVSAGGVLSCGLRADGTAVCWGSNSYPPWA